MLVSARESMKLGSIFSYRLRFSGLLCVFSFPFFRRRGSRVSLRVLRVKRVCTRLVTGDRPVSSLFETSSYSFSRSSERLLCALDRAYACIPFRGTVTYRPKRVCKC